MPLSTVTITGSWVTPSNAPATGQVTFSPVQDAPGGGYIVVASGVTVQLVNGAISTTLVSNSQATTLQYLVTEQITNTPNVSYVITPSGATLDLSTAPRGTVGTTTPVYVLASTVGQPNGVASLDGGTHVPLAQIPALPESQVTNLVADLAGKVTKDTLVWNVKDHGVVGDGVTDDATAFQAVVNAAPAGAILYAPPGTYLLRSGIKWPQTTAPSLIGAGPGRTILKPYNAGPLASGFSCIYNYTDGSISNTFNDVTFANFEIDGSGVTTTSYDVGSKGINILYMRRAKFLNLYIHDTLATGIGCDQLVDTQIDNCVLVGCGRQNDGTQPGGAGIGIGSGAFQDMQLSITKCVTRNNGTHGIFIEHQFSGISTLSRGVRIANCWSSGNNYGISDWGADGLIVSGCDLIANRKHGFYVSGQGVAGKPGVGGEVSGCVIDSNTGNGIQISDSATGRYTVTGNRISNNSGYGVQFLNVAQANTVALLEMSVTNNDIWLNALDAVRVDAPITDSHINVNRIRNNGIQSAASDSGTCTAVDTGTLTDTSKTWLLDAHKGKTLTVGSVTATVIGNTATVLTLATARSGSAWSGSTPSAGASYTLPAAAGGSGVLINAGTSHLLVRGNRIHDNLNNNSSYGSARRQLYALNVTATGTLSACQVENNDVLGNLTGAFQFTTSPSGGFYVRWNSNYNPRGIITPPSMPASGTGQQNTYGADATVFVTGGTVTAISVNGTTTGLTSGAIPLGPNATIAITYSSAPTWQWYVN